MNNNIFVTVFNRNYLDKGLVLFQSLKNNVGEFKLYVLALDELSYKVLSEMQEPELIPIHRNDFEDDTLRALSASRTEREYCWTCSSLSILYVLDQYKENICTYIDADMYFYSSPATLFDELYDRRADVGIMRHGFLTVKENERYLKNSGEFCVEFNTFRNNENGRKVLEWWCKCCIKECTEQMTEESFGDQKYVEQFLDIFKGVHVYENIGAGVAPWNVGRFLIASNANDDSIIVTDKRTRNSSKLIFYHFQQIRYISSTCVDINANMYPGRISKYVLKQIYVNYLELLNQVRKNICLEYNFNLSAETQLVKKTKTIDFIAETIKFERDVLIAISRLARWMIRKNRDYISF